MKADCSITKRETEHYGQVQAMPEHRWPKTVWKLSGRRKEASTRMRHIHVTYDDI